MIKILVSQRADSIEGRNERRDSVDQRLTEFVVAVGGMPIPVPNLLFDTGLLNEWLNLVEPDAILLSGGNDIGTCPDRDQTELALLDYAECRKLPVLGICRGMQLMAHRMGVSLKQIDHHVAVRHAVNGEISLEVNSFHNLALEKCPDDFKVLAIAEGGEIEAIAHKSLNWQGWMWHPERETPFAASDIERFRSLLVI